jgi:glycosyltransferase involved in cell wall biosynthesis
MSGDQRPPIRVLVASDSIPERNGVGAYYVDLLAQLRGRGCETALVCPEPARDRLRLPLPGDATQRIYWPAWGRFRARLRDFEPDVVVVATPGPYGLAGARWSRRLKRPLLVGFHTHYAGVTDLYPHAILRVLSRAYFRSIDRMLFRHAAQVLGNSDEMLELAGRMGAPGLERIGTLLPQAVLDTPWVPPSGRIRRILFAGRLAPEKRLHHVLETAREMPGVEFAIAGDGPLRAEVVQASEQQANIHYLGWLSRQRLIDAMDAAARPSSTSVREDCSGKLTRCGASASQSAMPQVSVTTAMRPRAIASRATLPKDSTVDGSTRASAASMASIRRWRESQPR